RLGGGWRLPQQRPPQNVQADRADVQCLAVEGLEIEPFAGFKLGPDLLPEPLTHLVRGCLPGPAEIAGEFELELAFADVEVGLEEVKALLGRPGSGAPAFGDG